ncbi:MAG: serpin family protein [Nanoarchaeota archaeon]|nr:serpin family protein [Nanoarchaeota archaeon]
MKLKLLIIIGIISAFLIAGCTQPKTVDDSTVTPEAVKAVVDANNQFALDYYSKIISDTNIFFSPYSISTALAMTYEGAKGQTADEMKSVFHYPDIDIMRPAYANIYNEINKKGKEYKLSTANALWAQEDYTFLPEYFSTINQFYGGEVTNLNFKTETEKSRVTINNWIEDQTNDKIKDLIGKGDLKEATRLVLTNAIYFKGTWLKKFKKSNTRDQDFKVNNEKTVTVPMMTLGGEEANFNYLGIQDLQILELPYSGEELSMLILLPKGDLTNLESELSIENINQWRAMLKEQNIRVSLPKFKFETKNYMAEDLIGMGMPTAFSNDADFSGMDGTLKLKIDKVIHQAFVEVNEEGTEAAAATAVIMIEKSMAMPTEFKADHPFIFLIQQKDTGNILFMGKVTDPTK